MNQLIQAANKVIYYGKNFKKYKWKGINIIFNWKDFKNGKFYVEVTHNNVEDFISECDMRGLRWSRGERALDDVPLFIGKAYIAHDILRPIFNGLCVAAHIEDVEKSGLPLIEWSDYEIKKKTRKETAQPFTWIPCTERLPEESGDYLTALTDGRYEVIHYSARYSFYGVYDECSLPVKVIAWAEIPPYLRSDTHV